MELGTTEKAARPLFVITWIFGIVDNSSSLPHVVYCVAHSLLIACLGIRALVTKYKEYDENSTSPTLAFMSLIYQVVALLLAVAVFVAQHFFKGNYHQLLQTLDHNASSDEYPRRIRRCAVVMAACSTPIIVTLLIEEVNNWSNEWLSVIYAWLVTSLGILMSLKMIIVVFAIRVSLEHINKQIQLLSSENCNSLEKLKKRHTLLCSSIEEINRLFEPSILFSTMMHFINLLVGSYFITLMIYNLEISFSENREERLLGTLFWFVLSWSSFGIVCNECDKTVCEARKTSNLLLKLELHAKDASIKEEAKMFRDQALHNEKCSFSIYGLFCVDRRLIAAMFGSMVTYLVTVVQFHLLTNTLA